MAWIRWARAPLVLLVALAAPYALVGCGNAPSDQVAGVDDCPPYPVWNRNVHLYRHGYVPGLPEIRAYETVDKAVYALATEADTKVTIRATRGPDPSADPQVKLELEVIDDRGHHGAYLLAHHPEGWIVSGGNGCGAPPPTEMTAIPSNCPTPTPSPGQHDYVYSYICEG